MNVERPRASSSCAPTRAKIRSTSPTRARSAGTFLTGVPFKITNGADVYAAVSMDQMAARELSKETQIASLELGIESNAMVGNCDGGASCAYTNTICWRSATTPLPMEPNPRTVFERLLGSPAPPEPEEACREALARYGFGQQWLPVARSLVANALDTPLMRPGEAGGVFRLSDLDSAVAEMEFHLPVRALKRPELGRCLEEHGYDRRLADDDAKIEGFLHGYIDLVACHEGRWYVIDYKSNRLGPDLAAYSEPALAEAIREHAYHLQYLLYLTALHRLLRLRLPGYDYDRDIGRAFSLFLPGMTPNAPPSAASPDRPSPACIEARAFARPMPRVLWRCTTRPFSGQRRRSSLTMRPIRAGSPMPIESHRKNSSTPSPSYLPAMS